VDDELVDELVDLLDELLLPDDDDPVPEDPVGVVFELLTDGIVTGMEVVMGVEVVMGMEVVTNGTLGDDTLPVVLWDELPVSEGEGVAAVSVTSNPSTKERIHDNGE
jgi:hypothetical protein